MQVQCLAAAFCGLLALMTGCARQQVASDTRPADETAIREAEVAWSKAASDKQLDATVSYYAEDGSVFMPNAPVITGRDAIRKAWVQLFATPGFSISWQPVKVEAARSSDLAYAQGTYAMAMNDPKGKPVQDRGKYVAVWKKQADQSWKVVADIFNSDLPPAR